MPRLFLVGCLVAAAVAWSFPGVARAEQPSGGIYVTTLPGGADIWIDGTYVGRSPVLVDALAPGRHALTITKTRWSVLEVGVDVAAGSIAMSSLRLIAGPKTMAGATSGRLAVHGLAPGAELSLDGSPLHGDPRKPVPLAVGSHRLSTLTSRGRITRTFTVLPDTTTDVVLQEPRADDARSSVVAPAEDYLPDDAYVVDGKKVVIHYLGHLAVLHLGDPSVRFDGTAITFDGAPETIGGKLYLPLELLEKLRGETPKGK